MRPVTAALPDKVWVIDTKAERNWVCTQRSPSVLNPIDRRAGHALGKKTGFRAEIGIDAKVQEAGAPAPLTVRGERLRVGAIVIIEQGEAERSRRPPFDPPIEAGPVIDLDHRLGFGLLDQRDERI